MVAYEYFLISEWSDDLKEDTVCPTFTVNVSEKKVGQIKPFLKCILQNARMRLESIQTEQIEAALRYLNRLYDEHSDNASGKIEKTAESYSANKAIRWVFKCYPFKDYNTLAISMFF